MLKAFRHKGVAKKVLWFVCGIIILSFGFGFGMNQFAGQTTLGSSAGKVFGKTITLREFQRYYADVRDQAILTQGPEFERMLQYIDMEGETWTRILLVEEARQKGIKIDDRDVISALAAMPAFQRDGSFDKKLYNNVVARIFRREARAFEEGLRDQLKIARLLQTVTRNINVTEQEARQAYADRNRKVQVNYVLVDPNELSKDIKIEENTLQPYFDGHREEFLVPDSINVQYVRIPHNGKEQDIESARKKAQEFYQAATAKDADFTAAAKTAGLDIIASGFFNMDDPAPLTDWPIELIDRLFTAKKGDILPPEQASQAFVVARPTEHRTAYIPGFDEVKEKVRARLAKEQADKLAGEKANDILETIKSRMAQGTTFQESALHAGTKSRQTPFFANGEYIPEIGISEDFSAEAFKVTKENPLSGLITTSKGPAILSFQAEQPADEKKYEEIKGDFMENLKREKSSQAINDLVREVKARANLVSYLDKIKKK